MTDLADYVECDECGHPIEEHTTKGCETALDEPCVCPTRWTQKQIRELRMNEGLPAVYRPMWG